MKKINKIILIHLGFLLLVMLVIIFSLTKGKFIYGSNVDFIRQHAVFPDYFRNLFYETGKIFPEFALHLGGGQNIFYFAYYGFLSPITLLSYLFPFLNMTTYLIIITIIIIYISALLFYLFLRKNNFNYNYCFIGSLLFLLSSSLIFHSHRHIMFVNYMPFLLLALIGVIKYFKEHKSLLLIISISLMILTSFYFSIPGIITVCLYGLYFYLKINSEIKLKDILKSAFLFLIRIFLGIFLSSLILLPTIYIILNGRSSASFSFNLTSILPQVNLEFIMYGTYGLGTTAIVIIGIIYNLLFGKKENRTLSIFLSFIVLIPIINLLLNGGLYQNGKIFIPLLPVFILLTIIMLESIKNNTKWIILIITTMLSLLFIKSKTTYLIFTSIDIIITLIILYFFSKKQKFIYLIPILVIAFCTCIMSNQSDKLVSKNDFQKIKETNQYDYEEKIQDENYRFLDNSSNSNTINYSKAKNDYRTTSYSSTTNSYYTEAFYNTFNNNDIYRNKFMLDQTNNLFFERFMGIKYLLSNRDVPFGYEKIEEYTNSNLYKSENVLPIGFASSNILNIDEYNNLSFNEQLEAFNNNIIINNSSKNADLNFLSKKINLDYQITEIKNITYENINDHLKIDSLKNGKIVLNLNEPLNNESLIIRFKMNYIPSCKEGDTAITINDITNKLTCKTWKYYNNNETFDYVISSNSVISELIMNFSKGKYDISEIEIYTIPNDFFKVNNEKISPLNINNTYTQGNILSGSIDVKENGYFIFTIPYDKGFNIYVDGQKQDYEIVNTAFIGFEIPKGYHQIELKFQAPLFKAGKIISFIFLLSICLLLIFEFKKSNI